MYQIPSLDLKHGFSTKEEGDMSFSFSKEEDVVKNRANFLAKMRIQVGEAVSMKVQHKDTIVVVDKNDSGRGMNKPEDELMCDCLITKDKGVFLFLKIADCAPLIILDKKLGVLGLAHMGWLNVDCNFAEKVVNTFKNSFKSDCKNLSAVIGPCARKDSYIVESPNQVNNGKWRGFIEESVGGSFNVDFAGLLKKQLIESGIPSDSLIDCGIDTIKDKRFYSHFTAKKQDGLEDGRFACVVGLI